MDDLDRQILTWLQKEIPLVRRPFEAIGKKLGTDGGDILLRINRLKDQKIIRQISAIFDTKSLGYKSMLVAMRFPESKIDAAAEVINQHPGVSHNYKRSHDFNLWFTVAVPPQDSLEEHIQRLHELSGAEKTLKLPTLKLYKIGVKLDLTGKESKEDSADEIYDEARRRKEAPDLTVFEIEVIRSMQEDLPLRDEPYLKIASGMGTTEEELFRTLESFRVRGYLRRMAGILHHRRAGFAANSMFVWQIPEERLEEAGMQFALFREVSHCYKRPVYPEFPYAIYTMVHAAKVSDCELIAQRMEEKVGKWPRLNLLSTKEYKKIRLKYFTKELEDWWASSAVTR
ncbi:MAG: Lrp/AsnC family transcriptional regulator [Candidatus Omnitrophica bacterium]|nr:Lrp/AsnC family transcriptional regulator [Candidatus Omnitrophota bacterium]